MAPGALFGLVQLTNAGARLMEGIARVRRIPKAGITDSTLRRLLQGQARLVQRPLLSGGGRLCSRGDLVVRHRDGRLHQGAHSREAHPRRRSRHTCLSVILFFVHTL